MDEGEAERGGPSRNAGRVAETTILGERLLEPLSGRAGRSPAAKSISPRNSGDSATLSGSSIRGGHGVLSGGFLHAQHRHSRRHDEVAVGQRRQIHTPHAVAKLVGHAAGELDPQPRLAAPTGVGGASSNNRSAHPDPRGRIKAHPRSTVPGVAGP
jgi:hypothetical protein